MELGRLIEGMEIEVIGGGQGDGVEIGKMEIRGVTDDSRKVGEGWMFVARQGAVADGRRFVEDAVARGAGAVLGEGAVAEVGERVVRLGTMDVKRALGRLADRFYGRVDGQVKVIGVTGTNGKTTTAFMIQHLLGGHGKCGLMGTIRTDDGARVEESKLTTLGTVEVSEMLGRMGRNGCGYCAMEVSSHALDQGRVAHVGFAGAVFTNLTGDHLDYHGTMEAYGEAKAKLFGGLGAEGVAVVNGDDAWGARMAEQCAGKVMRYSMKDKGSDIYGEVEEGEAERTRCRFAGPWGEFEAILPLVGRHNVQNMMGALGAAWGMGVEWEELTRGVETCPSIPGRLEVVRGDGEASGFTVVVDYAHTDDALEHALRALRNVTRGKLRVMMGCGGDRDATKRPRMGRAACAGADEVVVTSDNPRTENPRKIIEQILEGIGATDRGRVEVVVERREAIRRIIETAEAGDVVLLAGKGHEDYQIVGTERRRFDDREEARRILNGYVGREKDEERQR